MANTKITSRVIADNAVTSSAIADGAITASKIASDAIDIVADTTPQLGGNLDVNGNAITGSTVQINGAGGELMISATENGPVALRYDNNLKLTTKSDGVDITGELQSDSLDVDGDADILGTIALGNLTIAGAQGTDGQVLTSTGSGIAWEDAAGGVAGIVSSADATAITIDSSENVGIGIPNPSTRTHIYSSASSTPLIVESTANTYVGIKNTTQTAYIGAVTSNMYFENNGAERMRISQYGALHIDTVSDYTGKQWLNENTAGSPLGGSNASVNTYQKLRLWVDGDINLNQGRGIHFGDVTDSSPLCIREGSPSQWGTDQDRLEIWGRKQITFGSSYGRVATGDTSEAGTARGSAFYIQKTGQMGGTWVEVITTPNGGDQNCRIFEDWTGRWVMVGRFAADARASIQGTWSSVSGLSTDTSQSTTTAFSADWGDAYPSEVRIMGCTDVEEYMDTRTIDFVYGNRPGGVHSYTPRQWKHFFAGGTSDGMTQNAGGSPRYGFSVGYAYDGKGRWYNPNMEGMGMSDANTTNPIAAYSTATSNAFNWNTAQDAKLLATHYRTFASQDSYQTTGFGQDDNVQGFYDSYPTEYTNMGGGTTGGGVHATLTSAVFILLKLHW